MGLKRDIGLIGAAFIALNGIVGAGIFASPAELTTGVGTFSPYLYPIFGALMLSVAVVMGELASRFDEAGGPVVYANAAFGPFAGFQAGWLLYLGRISAFAANANAFLTYLAAFTPGVNEGVARAAIIIAMAALLVAVNVVGVKQSMRTISVLTVLKLTPLIVLALWGIAAFADRLPPPSPVPSLDAVGGVSLLLLYSFVAFEIATLTAGETRDAKRNVPLALVGTIAAMTVLYFLIQLAYVAIMGDTRPEGAPLAAAARQLAGPAGAVVITIAALISIGGNMTASFLTTPRITFALAEEGSLPKWFGAVSRFATPANSIIALGVIAGAMAVSGAFVWLAVMSALARLMVYLLCSAALPKLAGLKALGLRLLAPLAATALCVWAAAQAKPEAWTFLAGFVLVGTALYAASRWRSRASRHI